MKKKNRTHTRLEGFMSLSASDQPHQVPGGLGHRADGKTFPLHLAHEATDLYRQIVMPWGNMEIPRDRS